MANGKSFLIDTTKCFACRSCQVACKQWNELPAEDPVPTNRGTYENPPDLSHTQWLKIQFKESERADGSVAWNFVRNSCRHCLDAPCRQNATNKDAIVVDEATGAVLFGEGTKNESYANIRLACAFDCPRQGPDGQLFKCRMCADRLNNEALPEADRIPACAKACPSDAIEFGDRDEILAMAYDRLAAVQADGYPNAKLLDPSDVRLIILIADEAAMYSLSTRD
ncbi:MAG: 4Fe-4S dicluster domain-containing protein [Phycisphaerae bacterium]|jgi:formate dehydrogenase iron-sulfur subunit